MELVVTHRNIIVTGAMAGRDYLVVLVTGELELNGQPFGMFHATWPDDPSTVSDSLELEITSFSGNGHGVLVPRFCVVLAGDFSGGRGLRRISPGPEHGRSAELADDEMLRPDQYEQYLSALEAEEVAHALANYDSDITAFLSGSWEGIGWIVDPDTQTSLSVQLLGFLCLTGEQQLERIDVGFSKSPNAWRNPARLIVHALDNLAGLSDFTSRVDGLITDIGEISVERLSSVGRREFISGSDWELLRSTVRSFANTAGFELASINVPEQMGFPWSEWEGVDRFEYDAYVDACSSRSETPLPFE